MYREYLYHKLLKSKYHERKCWVGYQLLATLILPVFVKFITLCAYVFTQCIFPLSYNVNLQPVSFVGQLNNC